jgi:hypothetical protein
MGGMHPNRQAKLNGLSLALCLCVVVLFLPYTKGCAMLFASTKIWLVECTSIAWTHRFHNKMWLKDESMVSVWVSISKQK